MRFIRFASMFAVVLSVLAPRRVWAQELAVAWRGPRFIAAWAGIAKGVDASNAAVLRRTVALDLTEASIADALEAVRRAADLDISYTGAALPAGKAVSLHARDLTVAAALTQILLDAGLDVAVTRTGRLALVPKAAARPEMSDTGAIVGRVTAKAGSTPLAGATVMVEGTRHTTTTGSDGRYRIANVAPGTYTVRARYIGYSPGTAPVTVTADQEATADFTLEKSAQHLDEVVTTGTVVPTEVKALPTPISVVTSEDIERNNLQRVDQVFRGQVPGAIAWDQGPLDHYASINVRGASTINAVPSLKTFVDGVEVANPTYTIDANSIDRVEVTRGPQASTLYGAGALNGVMQIFTKKGRFGLTRPEVMGKASIGGVGGFDGQSTALQTDNAISVLGGGERASYNLGGSYRHVGEWVPSYRSSDWGVSGGGQITQGPLTLSGSARYADKTFDYPWDTRFQAYIPYSRPYYLTTSVRDQTYGATASLQATSRWQHTLTLGYNQTYYSDYQTQPRFTTPDDSSLAVDATTDVKRSLLYHTDLNLRLGTAVTAIVTAGVNYYSYEFLAAYTSNASHTTGGLDGSTFRIRNLGSSTGYFGQVQVSLAERLFLTGGLRAERNPNFGAGYGTAWSPRVGAAYLLGLGAATVKLRASYGEGIRAPDPGARDASASPYSIQLASPNLAPERQRGEDGGIEVYFGRTSLGVTYYNQRAIDLIEFVQIITAPGSLPTYQDQNFSRVKNDGWEFEARLPLGPVQISGTYSITNSTVQALPPSGGYQVGDAIHGIPHTSAGATLSYSPLPRTTVTANMTYIGHWTTYDNIALNGYYYGGQPYRGSFQAYLMEYPTVMKFAVGASQAVTRDVTAFVRAENVGNTLRFEQSNSSIPMPRSVIIGVNIHS